MRFRSGVSIGKKAIFMIFCAKMLKKSMTIRKTKNILNDYNVHVSCHYLCFEESIEKMNYGTCLINKYERKFGGAPTNKYWRKICVFIIMIVFLIIIVIIVVLIIFVVMNINIISLLRKHLLYFEATQFTQKISLKLMEN